jgi:type I restriction-modification system DNA methylase subunit
MKTSSIRIEGNILSPELFDKLDSSDIIGQSPLDFGFDRAIKVKDDIARAWADAKDQWNIFKRRIEKLSDNSGTDITRKYWIIPLLENFGYSVTFQRSAEMVNNKPFAISHRAENLDGLPVHIMGVNDYLDKRRESGGPRMSPHGLLQEYLNETEHLFGLVTNGYFLRLLRNSGKLVRLSYMEFNLQRMLEDDLYAEFSIMYRLIHSSRMPKKQAESEGSIIEQYHQEAIESGSRIREKLSFAVEQSIKTIANGFLHHPDNNELRELVKNGTLKPEQFFQYLLRFIYRILFLLVIEERDIVFPGNSVNDAEKREEINRFRDIYYNYYSISRLRKLAEKIYFFDDKLGDLWTALKNTFAIFEEERAAGKLGLYPLGGELFSGNSIGSLAESSLGNKALLECIRNLSLFESPQGKEVIRVNYAALNVEEFGSVYEGLLEYNGRFNIEDNSVSFEFVKSSERSSSGSHYTPEELVQPLIKHSLDYILEERIKAAEHYSFKERSLEKNRMPGVNFLYTENETIKKYFADVSLIIEQTFHSGRWRSDDNYEVPGGEQKPRFSESQIDFFNEKNIGKWWNQLTQARKYTILAQQLLLSVKVCDAACGSGHILLSAARRIAFELAKVWTGEEQPSPGPYRKAVREVINHCIYGVDKNPLAVELCKVALWLEAYNPGMPLSFLDHRIKCGDSIVGIARKEELYNGISAAAFKKMPGDDAKIVKELLKKHKNEVAGIVNMFDTQEVAGRLSSISTYFNQLDSMPEQTLQEIKLKAEKYDALKGAEWWALKEAADLQVSQFFIPKTEANKNNIATYADYICAFSKERARVQNKIARAMAVSVEKRIFHWFLEFPEVFEAGGFDCILGNPPFLGGQKLSGNFGDDFLNYVKTEYAPAGSCDLVTYFFRRIFNVIKDNGFQALISTNTIAQGNAREGGLDVIEKEGGVINFAVKSTKWPGVAAVEVSLVALHKGIWNGKRFIGNIEAAFISTYLDDSKDIGKPFPLKQNENKSFQGSIVLGKGFVLEPGQASELINKNPRNKDVLFPYLNGEDLNSDPEQKPSRWVINFFDWDEEYCKNNYPDCYAIVERDVKPERIVNNDKIAREKWWQFLRLRGELYKTISEMQRVLVMPRVSKYLLFTFVNNKTVFHDKIIVFSYDNLVYFPYLQSSLHNEWAWKYSTTLGSAGLSYTPNLVFEPFPFPTDINNKIKTEIEIISSKYHEFRKTLMINLQLGLTKTYNLFHTKDLQPDDAQLQKANLQITAVQAVKDIETLRQLHKQMDEAVLKAYGWEDINLAHGFYEVDYLPENDRIRYTISPEARKVVLSRLLALNHKIHSEEVNAGLWEKKKAVKKSKPAKNKELPEGFIQEKLF